MRHDDPVFYDGTQEWLKAGDKVLIELEADESKSYEGTVKYITEIPEEETEDIVYKAIIDFKPDDSVFFGMTVSCLVRYRENVMLIMVFVSVPLLFLSGVSWPQSSIPGAWQGISWLFPSTFGIRAFVRMNTLGGTISDVASEVRCLWIQVAAYFGAACLVYGHQLRLSRRHAQERLIYLRRKREVRQQLKQKQLHSRTDLQKS